MSKQREAFEAWRQECGYDTEAFKSVLELAWQASRAAALEEAAAECEQTERHYALIGVPDRADGAMDCHRAIRALKEQS